MSDRAVRITATMQEELAILASGIANNYGVRHDRLASMTFAQMANLFKSPMLILTTKNFTIRLIQVSSTTYQSHEVAYNKTTFIFSALLVSMHSNQIFAPNMPPEEKRMIMDAALKVKNQFMSVLDALLHVPPANDGASHTTPDRLTELTARFDENLVEFNRLFGIWRHQDIRNLIERIRNALFILREAIFIFSANTEIIDTQHPMISAAYDQMNRLRMKLSEIGGEEELAKYDALVREEMADRRMLFLLRQEHARYHHRQQQSAGATAPNSEEPEHIFDLVQ